MILTKFIIASSVNYVYRIRKRFNRLDSILVLFLFVLILSIPYVVSSTGYEPAFTEQLSFKLDLDSPEFNYTLDKFNDSSNLITMDFDTPGNRTHGIILPKNSTVTEVEFNLSGYIKPYKTCIGTSGVDNNNCAAKTSIRAIEIGDVVSASSGQEICIASEESQSDKNTIFVTNRTGSVLWADKAETIEYPSRSSAIGDFLGGPENEFIVSGDSYGVRVYGSTDTILWNYTTGGKTVYAVAIGNITYGSENELVYGDENGDVVILNTSSNTGIPICTYASGSKINSIVISDIDGDSENEILVGASNFYLYIINSSCSLKDSYYADNYIIKSIASGNITDDAGAEIILGAQHNITADGIYYMLNSTLDMIWNRTYSNSILSVAVGELDHLNTGLEIIGGSSDNSLHLLSRSGVIYWTYTADAAVSSMAIGNVSEDTGSNTNEFVIGTMGGANNLQIMNFDNFPTNLTLDIGGDATIEWNYTGGDGRLRNSTIAANSQLIDAINDYLINNCTESVCTVPVTFNTGVTSILEAKINVTYTYNASSDITYENIPYWTKTANIVVNESIISRAKNISFNDPALNITIRYIRMNNSADQCGFDSTNYTNITLASINYCDISSLIPQFKSTPNTHSSSIFWDDQMKTEVPVTMNASVPYFTTGMDNNYWRRNITIISNNTYTTQSFTNITANITLNDSATAVRGREYFNVTWSGTTCDIIPPTQQSSCDVSSPETQMTCNGTNFYICKKDLNSNGVFEFIKWIQPTIDALANIFYQVGGSSNLYPIISNASVSPSEDTWQSYFNYSVYINDTEGDTVNISLYTYSSLLDIWTYRESKNITGTGIIWFNISNEKEMTGTPNKYRFLYQDLDGSFLPLHSSNNTEDYSGPSVTKHNLDIIHILGSNTDVTRSDNSTTLIVRINDTTLNEFINETDVLCTFNVTYDKTNYKSGIVTTVNETGYCAYTFYPDSAYSIGQQTWKADIDTRYYNPITPAVNWTLNILGRLNISLTEPSYGQIITRNTSISMKAKLVNHYGLDINSSSINISNYNCSWYFNNTYLNTTTIQTNGSCTYVYTTDCNYTELKDYPLEVKLNYTLNPANYTITSDTSQTTIQLYDNLTIVIDSPSNASSYYNGDTIILNSTIDDPCSSCTVNNKNISWYKDLDIISIYINETKGFAQDNVPIIITGAELESTGINLDGWHVNSTKITTTSGVIIPNMMLDTTGVYLNRTSKLVFLANLTAYSNNTYYLTHNESDVSGTYETSYIPNGGFENNSKDSWIGDGIIESIGTEPKGNYSLKLFAFDSDPLESATQTFHPLTTQNVKIWYKQKGQYDSASNPDINVTIGNYLCNLPLISPTSSSYDGTWQTHTCTDSSILGAKNITFTILSTITAGSTLYIDHICVADDSGNCISEDYGSTITENIHARELLNTTTTEDTHWTIPFTQPLGIRTITAEVTGNYYFTSSDLVSIYIYGYSNVSEFDYSSSGCDGTLCFAESIIDLACYIRDANTTKGIYNYSVDFYDNATLINTNGSIYTDSLGVARYSWKSSSVYGNHTISCNISDSSSLYYNTTSQDSNYTIITIFGEKTNASLSFKEGSNYLNSTYRIATNISKNRNVIIQIPILINNTGISAVSSPEIIAYNQTGITLMAGKYNAISVGSSYATNITVNISRISALGNISLNTTLRWANNATPFINQTIIINITNTTILDIIDNTSLEYDIPYGGTKLIGNFTIEAFGNTELNDIKFSLQGGDSDRLKNWTITYSNESFDINRFGYKTITVTVSVPSNASLLGNSYWTYIVANNTGSACIYSYEACTDTMLMNITVIDQDWEITPKTDLFKIVGLGGKQNVGSFDDLINITNLKNSNLTINISIINQSSFLNFTYILNTTIYQLSENESSFIIPPLSFANINIAYNVTNASTSDTGTYAFNITTYNLDSDSVPRWINRSVSFTLSSLNVEIISPNSTSRSIDILAGDILNITINTTYNGNIINNTENTTIDLLVSGQNCTKISTQFIQQLNLWFINCTAPHIPDNLQNNSVSATVTYLTQQAFSMSYTATEENVVEYRDITSPSINTISINSILLNPATEANVKYQDALPSISFIVNVTDNVAVKNVWLNIVNPQGNSTTLILTQNPQNTYLWNGTYPNPNLIGDYKVIISANDSIIDHDTNTTVWFDVYRDIEFTDTMKDASNKAISAKFELYKSGTNWTFHRFTTDSLGFYNWTTHKRTYDIKITALDQIVRFNNFNITSSAINKTNQSDPSSLAGAIKLHLIPNSSPQTNASNIDLPNTAENILMAYVIHTPGMNYDNATVVLDYEDALLSSWTANNDENDIRLFYCSDWDFSSFMCSSGEFIAFDTSIKPDVASNTFTFTTTHNSAYALANWCGGYVCGSSPPTPISPGSVGSGGDGGSGSTPVCGNNICEYTENEENCPIDCTLHICGNGICEPTENNLNCPLDCSSEDFEYTTDFDFINMIIDPGENQTHQMTISNNNNNSIDIGIKITGDIKEYMKIVPDHFTLEARSNETVKIIIQTEKQSVPGAYLGSIKITSDMSEQVIPVILKISDKSERILTSLDLVVEILTKKIIPRDTLRFNVMLYDLGIIKDFNVTLTYNIKESKTEQILMSLKETINLTGSTNLRKSIDLKKLDKELANGQYFLEIVADYSTKRISATDTFEVTESFWSTTRGKAVIAFLILIILAVLTYYGYKRYIKWKISKARYVFPVDNNKLPHESNAFSIGKIAETNRTANFNPNDLTTHMLVTGSTGAGKSVAASVVVEEALKQKIPVVVFDPTAQWTGFVRPCKDNNLLKYYSDFGMRTDDAHPFTGMIFEVTDPHVKLDFKKYMNPGEITVFTLNKLKPGEYDTAVQCIIDTIFTMPWEESTSLKMIVVFDEVHRLLEKYGGKGGYISLEKACREFRKWGIGMIMCSQVYSDFKEAIQGNILTEVQLNTKSMSDISKVKEKYGVLYSEKISRQGVGVGMIQNPRYNDGKPWFVQFRPTYHAPHKITEEELNLYKSFAEKLDKIESKIEKLKEVKANVMDLELELKLAKNKLKQGHFKMAEIYIESLSTHKLLGKIE